MKWLIGVWLVGSLAWGHVDMWDLPPIRYADTPARDQLAELDSALKRGERPLAGMSSLEKLDWVLKLLDVPESSQMLVFSKTSKQVGLIHPRNPRCLFFSENHYVGYVPGGAIEAIVQDPVLGPVFYLLDPGTEEGVKVMRDSGDCFSCHGTTRTEGVPGVLIRSVFPDADGHPMLNLGTTLVTHATPLEERWGGYYVTGRSESGHLGNRIFEEDRKPRPEVSALDDLTKVIECSKYPRATSDIVALLVIEHQCRVHNLLTAAAMQYRRSYFLSKAIDPEADPDAGQAGRISETMAGRVVEALLFKDEADLGEGVEGLEEFQSDFSSRFPRTPDGDSLADFKLYGRLFKNRCSYMVYSEAFRAMPPRVKSSVMKQLKRALVEGEGQGAEIGSRERKRIVGILEATLPAWSERE